MKKLIYILFVLITIAFVVAAIAGFATGRINPEGKEWISFPGLVLLPVLAANLCLFLMWCVFGGVIVELGVFDIDVPDTGLPKRDSDRERSG